MATVSTPSAADIQQMEPPLAGEQEVYFRRFLLRCFQSIERDNDTWKRDPVFHRYVEELQDRLAELRNNVSLRLADDVVSRYVELVEHLSNGLLTPDVPLFCKKLPKNRTDQQTPQMRLRPVHQPSTSEPKPDIYRHVGRLVRSSNLGDEAKKTLDTQSEIQESITDELIQMARDLKKRTLSMESAVQKRNAVMDDTSDALDYSANAAREASKRSAKQYKSSKIGTCRMLMILLLVGCVFTAMIIFIRITSFVGYKAARETEL